MATLFEDLPFELRYKIFKISRKNAFKRKIVGFSLLFEKFTIPKIFTTRNNEHSISCQSTDSKCRFTIYISSDTIKYCYSNNGIKYEYVEWSKNDDNIWDSQLQTYTYISGDDKSFYILDLIDDIFNSVPVRLILFTSGLFLLNHSPSLSFVLLSTEIFLMCRMAEREFRQLV